ncbi:hypothetical protein [Paraburkholderia lacunae]|uniref:hypothetical protein n=1 Tax=Paraburkholderia lacunae TaxID=2211104 RepID=UPI001058BADB|nr:hypothetical protein [Paraburkholderia lacunae]
MDIIGEVEMRGKGVPLLVVLFLLPLAFDYKSTDADRSHTLQYVLVAPALIVGVLLALKGPRFSTKSQLRSLVSIALTLTVGGSIVPQLLQGNAIGDYLRVLLPFVLLLVGYLVGCHPWSESRMKSFSRYIFVGMALSMVASSGSGMASGGSIDELRYQIISPVLLGFQGLLLHEIVVRRRAGKVASIFFSATLAIELLSVTRSLLVGSVLLFCFATWLAAPTVGHLAKSLFRTFIVAVVLGGAVAAGVVSFLPSVLDHWSQRIFFAETTQSGEDPTTLSRLAELQDQYDQATSTVTSLMTGMGYGHHFGYSENYVLRMLEFSKRADLESVNAWQAGHNFWVYQFFAGGILFGVALPAALLYALYRCSMTYRRWRRVMPGAVFLDDMGSYLMVVAGMIATTVGGNPLGPRFSGLIYGLALGLLVAGHSKGIAVLRTARPLESQMLGQRGARRESFEPAFRESGRRAGRA